jgi:O-antigen ligase
LDNESRLLIWNVGLRLIRNNLLFGVGYGNFITSIPGYALFSGLPRAVRGVAGHNMFLTTLGELGIIGAFLFTCIFLFSIKKLLQIKIEAKKFKNLPFYFLSVLLFSLTIVFLIQGIVADINFWESLWLHFGIVQSFLISYQKYLTTKK